MFRGRHHHHQDQVSMARNNGRQPDKINLELPSEKLEVLLLLLPPNTCSADDRKNLACPDDKNIGYATYYLHTGSKRMICPLTCWIEAALCSNMISKYATSQKQCFHRNPGPTQFLVSFSVSYLHDECILWGNFVER